MNGSQGGREAERKAMPTYEEAESQSFWSIKGGRYKEKVGFSLRL